MGGRRQRRMISHEKKRKTRAATMKKKRKKKIVKKEPTPAPQDNYLRLKPTAARRSSRRRQDTDGQAAVPIKKHDDNKDNGPHQCDKRTCGLCGVGRMHENDAFCPYNYIDGFFSLRTCRERCHPGVHPLFLASFSGSGSQHQLRRVVRVTNVPLSVIPGKSELHWLFRQFRPLDPCCLTRVSRLDDVGFGWVAFESHEHAQEAINKLNGHLVGERKLRVDWIYPQT